MDVRVVDAPYQHKQEDLLDLSHVLFHKVFDKAWERWTPEQQKYWRAGFGNLETLSPDGNDHFKETGTLNLYMRPIHPELRPKVLEGIKYFLKDLGAEFGPFREEKGTDGDVRVVRIPILKMPATQQQPPSLNLSNANAYDIFSGLLNYKSDDHYYKIPVRDLLMKIDMLSQHQTQSAERPTSQDGNFIDMGLSQQQIDVRLGKIREIAKWAMDNHYDYISVS